MKYFYVLCVIAVAAMLAFVILGDPSISASKTAASVSSVAASEKPESISSVPASPWGASVDRDKMSDAKRIVLTNYAVHGFHSEELLVRCQSGKLSVYVNTSTIPSTVYGQTYGTRVKVRFDKTKAVSQEWFRSDDGEAMFSENPKALARQMLEHSQMLIEYEPVDEAPQVISFDVSGLDTQLSKYQECQQLVSSARN